TRMPRSRPGSTAGSSGRCSARRTRRSRRALLVPHELGVLPVVVVLGGLGALLSRRGTRQGSQRLALPQLAVTGNDVPPALFDIQRGGAALQVGDQALGNHDECAKPTRVERTQGIAVHTFELCLLRCGDVAQMLGLEEQDDAVSGDQAVPGTSGKLEK